MIEQATPHPLRKPAIIGALAGLGAGTILGANQFVGDSLGLQDEVGTTVESATVTRVVPLDKGCFLRYDSRIGSASHWDKRLKLGDFSAPTGISAHVQFEGYLKNELCNDFADMEIVTDTETGETDVNIDASHLYVDITRRDMDPDAYSYDPGALTAAAAITPTVIKVLNLDDAVSRVKSGENLVKGPDRLRNTLSDWALAGAMDASARSCGKTVWQVKQDTYADQVADMVTRLGDVDPDKLKVNFSGTPQFRSDWGEQVREVERNLGYAGVSVTSQDPESVECKYVPEGSR